MDNILTENDEREILSLLESVFVKSDELNTKVCNGYLCGGKILPINRFAVSKSTNSGVKTVCKMCEGTKNIKDFV